MMDSAIAGFGAHQGWMNAISNNVANVNTDRFRPTSTLIDEDAASNPQANFRVTSDKGGEMSQTDLTKEMSDMLITQNGFDTNAPVVKTKDEVLGTLLDLKG